MPRCSTAERTHSGPSQFAQTTNSERIGTRPPDPPRAHRPPTGPIPAVPGLLARVSRPVPLSCPGTPQDGRGETPNPSPRPPSSPRSRPSPAPSRSMLPIREPSGNCLRSEPNSPPSTHRNKNSKKDLRQPRPAHRERTDRSPSPSRPRPGTVPLDQWTRGLGDRPGPRSPPATRSTSDRRSPPIISVRFDGANPFRLRDNSTTHDHPERYGERPDPWPGAPPASDPGRSPGYLGEGRRPRGPQSGGRAGRKVVRGRRAAPGREMAPTIPDRSLEPKAPAIVYSRVQRPNQPTIDDTPARAPFGGASRQFVPSLRVRRRRK